MGVLRILQWTEFTRVIANNPKERSSQRVWGRSPPKAEAKNVKLVYNFQRTKFRI